MLYGLLTHKTIRIPIPKTFWDRCWPRTSYGHSGNLIWYFSYYSYLRIYWKLCFDLLDINLPVCCALISAFYSINCIVHKPLVKIMSYFFYKKKSMLSWFVFVCFSVCLHVIILCMCCLCICVWMAL